MLKTVQVILRSLAILLATVCAAVAQNGELRETKFGNVIDFSVKGPNGVWAWGDVRQAVARLMAEPPNAAQAEQLLKNKDALPSAFLFPAAYHLSKTDRIRAHRLFFLARIRTVYDARQCVDETARSGVGALFTMLGHKFDFVFAMNKENPGLVDKVLRELGRDAGTFKYSASPWWLCSHGMDAVIAGLDSKKLKESKWRVPEAQRKKIREELIASLIKTKAETGSRQH